MKQTHLKITSNNIDITTKFFNVNNIHYYISNNKIIIPFEDNSWSLESFNFKTTVIHSFINLLKRQEKKYSQVDIVNIEKISKIKSNTKLNKISYIKNIIEGYLFKFYHKRFVVSSTNKTIKKLENVLYHLQNQFPLSDNEINNLHTLYIEKYGKSKYTANQLVKWFNENWFSPEDKIKYANFKRSMKKLAANNYVNGNVIRGTKIKKSFTEKIEKSIKKNLTILKNRTMDKIIYEILDICRSSYNNYKDIIIDLIENLQIKIVNSVKSFFYNGVSLFDLLMEKFELTLKPPYSSYPSDMY